MSKQKVTASDMRAALAKRFSAPAWSLIHEVGNTTGFKCNRHADCVAVSLWPSRGVEFQGIEITVSRSDWLKELQQPEKADAIQKYCDRWWVATTPDIVEAGELPPNWGLLLLKSDKLVCEKEAPRLEAQALDRGFVAALLRNANGALSCIVEEARREGYNRGKLDEKSRLNQKVTELQKLIAAFKEASGVNLEASWNAGRIGEAVKKVMWLRDCELPGKALREEAERLARVAEVLRRDADEMEQVKGLTAGAAQ